MVNIHRGEIVAEIDGKTYTLCLTLGALAELEQALSADDLLSVAERFNNGKIKTTEIMHILKAGLKGGGYEMSFSEIENMKLVGGIQSYIDIVAKLLKAAFVIEDTDQSQT